MPLLHQIQEAIVQEGADLGSVLLKLRLLASKLGSDVLEDWVKHESEGYSAESEVPAYRVAGVSYKGTFFGPFNAQIRNAPIPGYLIKKFGGENWVNVEMRESISAIAAMAKKIDEGGHYGIDASNLILLLQGKIYEGYACNSIDASISSTAPREIVQAVRSRVLELTLELEKRIPAAALVTFGSSEEGKAASEKVQQISQQIIYGNVSNSVVGGPSSSITATISQGNKTSVKDFLTNSGIPEKDAEEFSEILESEQPDGSDEPFGSRAKAWIKEKLFDAPAATWKVGIAVATGLLTKAAAKFYGLG